MFRVLSVLSFVFLVVLSGAASACTCQASFSICNEVKASNVVLVGTVQSIEPIPVSAGNPSNGASLQSFNQIYSAAGQSPSETSLAQLKAAFLKIFPGSTAEERRQLGTANTARGVISLFNSAVDRGIHVRFKVRTLFKHEEDDDAPKGSAKSSNVKDDRDKDDEHKIDDTFDIWTPFGDCGYDFQVGETYLVFANNEEGSDYFFTDSCTRTRRLSDAGDDLAYLFFYKNQPEESAQLEGFVTSDPQNHLDYNHPLGVKSPVTHVVVELKSDRLTRYTQSDRDGRFVFDGLPKGDFHLAAIEPGDSLNPVLAGPHPVHIEEKSCGRQLLIVPKIRKE